MRSGQAKNGSAQSTNRETVRDSVEIFYALYKYYLDSVSDFNAIDHYFDGSGAIRTLLKPLIVKLTNFFLPRIESLLSKIQSYETRLRSFLITFPVLLLEVGLNFFSGKKIESKN
jgi:hypothetical protein